MPLSTTTPTTSSSSSKLGYLSKYTSTKGTGDEDWNHKTKKKDKKKKKKKEKTTSRGGSDDDDEDNKQRRKSGLLCYDSHDDDQENGASRHRHGSHAATSRQLGRPKDGDDGEDDDEDTSWMDDPDDRPVVVELSNEVVGLSNDDNYVTTRGGEKGTAARTMTRPRGVWKDAPHASGENAEATRTAPTITTTTNTAMNKKEDSPVRPRRRYDSSDDESPPPPSLQRPSPRHSPSSPRHDSKGKRRRYDSDEDDEPINTVQKTEASSLPIIAVGSTKRRRRYDSEESSHDDKEKKEAERQPRRSYDTDEDSQSDGKPVKQEERKTSSISQRRRHDSDSSDGERDDNSKARMSSGHKAGLQDYTEFNKEEAKIQTRKKQEAQLMVDKYGVGETVYRKGSGHGPQQKTKRLELDALQQAQLNLGKVQRDQAMARIHEFQALQESAFARHQDDEGLEAIRKNEIRQGDPMAAYAVKKRGQSKQKEKKSKHKKNGHEDVVVEEKPMYKGPPSKPNRHGIRPGYRWDGVDRGNGFEDKLLAKQYSANLKNEEEYRWRSADM